MDYFVFVQAFYGRKELLAVLAGGVSRDLTVVGVDCFERLR